MQISSDLSELRGCCAGSGETADGSRCGTKITKTRKKTKQISSEMFVNFVAVVPEKR
jgi:hypothetical protein